MKSLNSCRCENLVKKKVTDKIPIGGHLVEVIDAPARVCQDCGEIHFEGRHLLNLEKEIEERVKKAA